ncbi:MAG: RNA polymerase sigma factor [Planctomycetota bacterium]
MPKSNVNKPGDSPRDKPEIPKAESLASASLTLAERSDSELVEITRAHPNADERDAAFRVLVERYKSRVFNLCFKVLRNVTDAEDAAQDTFLKTYKKLESFRGDASFFSWLYLIALNTARDRLSSIHHRRLTRSRDITEFEPMPPPAQDRPDTALEREDMRNLARKALAKVPPHFRSVLILREFEGLQYKEIAAILGTTVGTVTSRVNRARESFKKFMEHLVPGIEDKNN